MTTLTPERPQTPPGRACRYPGEQTCTCRLVQDSATIWVRECKAETATWPVIVCQECDRRFGLHEWFYGHDCEV